jgi:hypothetical protein
VAASVIEAQQNIVLPFANKHINKRNTSKDGRAVWKQGTEKSGEFRSIFEIIFIKSITIVVRNVAGQNLTSILEKYHYKLSIKMVIMPI